MKLGERIKYLREQRNWSQQRLGEEANISQTYVSDLEANRKKPGYTVIKKLAKAFDIGLDELDNVDLPQTG